MRNLTPLRGYKTIFNRFNKFQYDTRKAVGTLILGSHRLIIVPYQFRITTPSQAPGLNVPLASTVPVLLTVPPVKLAPGATARMLPLT